jgi:hypothetical protein
MDFKQTGARPHVFSFLLPFCPENRSTANPYVYTPPAARSGA